MGRGIHSYSRTDGIRSNCDLERSFQRFNRFLKLIGPVWAVESAEQPPASVEKFADTNSVADLGRQPKRAVDHLESQPQISLGLRTVDLLLLALVSDLVLVQGRRLDASIGAPATYRSRRCVGMFRLSPR